MFSVVSHGQADLVDNMLESLLNSLSNAQFTWRIVVTINIDENYSVLEQYSTHVEFIHNNTPKGFGANHNAAFELFPSTFFAVLNPDLKIDFDFNLLLSNFPSDAGVCAPAAISIRGDLEDNYRSFPSFLNLIVRRLKILFRLPTVQHLPSSEEANNPKKVDWVAGLCMIFDSNRYRFVGGFDEKFYMYLEDADICRRLSYEGFATYVFAQYLVVHDARRASLKSWRHFRWHVASLLYFFYKGI